MEYLFVDISELGEWHFTFYIYVYSRYKGKGIPTTGHEGPRGMRMQRSTSSQPRRQKEVGWLALRLTVFTPPYSFNRRLSRPQDQCGHKVV